jgi:hypothetical protein
VLIEQHSISIVGQAVDHTNNLDQENKIDVVEVELEQKCSEDQGKH